jgi:hypothetical protein
MRPDLFLDPLADFDAVAVFEVFRIEDDVSRIRDVVDADPAVPVAITVGIDFLRAAVVMFTLPSVFILPKG